MRRRRRTIPTAPRLGSLRPIFLCSRSSSAAPPPRAAAARAPLLWSHPNRAHAPLLSLSLSLSLPLRLHSLAELMAVEIDSADVSLIQAELDLDAKRAERVLREAGGDVVAAMRAVLKA